ncbi:MAG: hypothetical protein FD170_531 [Bacteroidetes bacterium]|nr:MAG: hypothetical protein FD170_531 [Bacteroidota bacterium]
MQFFCDNMKFSIRSFVTSTSILPALSTFSGNKLI